MDKYYKTPNKKDIFIKRSDNQTKNKQRFYHKSEQLNTFLEQSYYGNIPEKEFNSQSKLYLNQYWKDQPVIETLICDLLYIISHRNFNSENLSKNLIALNENHQVVIQDLQNSKWIIENSFKIIDNKDLLSMSFLKILAQFAHQSSKETQSLEQKIIDSLMRLFQTHIKHTNDIKTIINCLGKFYINCMNNFDTTMSNKIFNLFTQAYTSISKIFSIDNKALYPVICTLLKYIPKLLQGIQYEQNMKLIENLFTTTNNYIYIGTTYQSKFFQLQANPLLYLNDNLSLNQSTTISSQSSQSELSDIENNTNIQQQNDLTKKIRIYAVLFLQQLFKNYPKLINVIWNKILPTNTFYFDKLLIVMVKQEFNEFSINQISSSKVQNLNIKNKFIENFTTPSLLGLVLFEKYTKVKVLLICLLCTITEQIPFNILISTKAQSIQSIKKPQSIFSVSQQAYNALKNILYTVIYLFIKEQTDDELIHSFQLLNTISNTLVFNKVNLDFRSLLIKQCLIKYIQSDNINTNCKFHCLQVVCSMLKNYFDDPISLFLCQEFNLVLSQFFKNVRNTFTDLQQNKIEPKYKQFHINLICEHFNILGQIFKMNDDTQELQKQYMNLFYKVEELDIKDITFSYLKVIEEYTSQILESKSEFQVIDEYETKLYQKPQFNQILEHMLISKDIDLVSCTLRIIQNLDNNWWNSLKAEKLKRIIHFIFKLKEFSALRISFVKTLGVLIMRQCIFENTFICEEITKLTIQYSEEKKNSNLSVNNSWTLANILSGYDQFEQKWNKNIKQLTEILFEYCELTKDKILINCIRGIGCLVRYIHSEEDIAAQYYQSEQIKQEFYQKIRKYIQKCLQHNNTKVNSNSCVTLDKILNNQKLQTENTILDVNVFDHLNLLLANDKNFKIQIQTLKIFNLVRKQYLIEINYVDQILSNCIHVHFESQKSKYFVEDYKLITNLQYYARKIIIDLMNELDLEQYRQIFQNFIEQSGNKIAQILSAQVMSILEDENFKENVQQLSHLITDQNRVFNKDKAFSSKSITNQTDIDEYQVTGVNEATKFTIEFKDSEQFQKFTNMFQCISNLCNKLVKICDSIEDVNTSFIVYDTYKEYSKLLQFNQNNQNAENNQSLFIKTLTLSVYI